MSSQETTLLDIIRWKRHQLDQPNPDWKFIHWMDSQLYRVSQEQNIKRTQINENEKLSDDTAGI